MKSHKTLLFLLILAFVHNAVLAVTVTLSPLKDNTLYEDPKGSLSNGHGIYLFTGLTGVAGLRRGLIAFDLSAIPTNATVTDASLSMFLSTPHAQTKSFNVSLHKALNAWGESASDAGEPGGWVRRRRTMTPRGFIPFIIPFFGQHPAAIFRLTRARPQELARPIWLIPGQEVD
jgi:hypothetical protein